MGSRRAAEKALLGENDRPVPETPLHTKHLKERPSFITGQHESCSTHTGNRPPSPSPFPQSLPSTAFCLNWRMARNEGWRGREESEEEHAEGQALFASGLTNKRREENEEGFGARKREQWKSAVPLLLKFSWLICKI